MIRTKEIQSHQSRVYHQLAALYEPLFARFFQERVRTAIQDMDIPPGAKVLEVGVGTGLSLAAYPHQAEVTGCDLSDEMLEQARAKIAEHGWRHIDLVQMDGQRLEFADDSFDYVTAFHVVTVVPAPQQLMSELVRVVKPGGTILIINHFRSHRVWLATFIDSLDLITRHLGWQTTLKLEDVVGSQPVRVEQRYKTASRSLFNVVLLRKTPQGSQRIPLPAIRRLKRPTRRTPHKAC